ncbi:hypothetical protein [Roseinatronobacter alkalisoli]|uniref:Uncharacterized protein n=1 Tax=Roseinatronobacter alkalisoli TaxID=3028235 RepID=A0ABT5T686_9RHOB|nr:hypothetical protein [Roseinatronobacter sp. HJB301]MDD7970612.1 hypothetical protein [Roseinatronobacter sp. HJB301]
MKYFWRSKFRAHQPVAVAATTGRFHHMLMMHTEQPIPRQSFVKIMIFPSVCRGGIAGFIEDTSREYEATRNAKLVWLADTPTADIADRPRCPHDSDPRAPQAKTALQREGLHIIADKCYFSDVGIPAHPKPDTSTTEPRSDRTGGRDLSQP